MFSELDNVAECLCALCGHANSWESITEAVRTGTESKVKVTLSRGDLHFTSPFLGRASGRNVYRTKRFSAPFPRHVLRLEEVMFTSARGGPDPHSPISGECVWTRCTPHGTQVEIILVSRFFTLPYGPINAAPFSDSDSLFQVKPGIGCMGCRSQHNHVASKSCTVSVL